MKDKARTQTVVAVRRDGIGVNIMALDFSILSTDPEFDLESAVRAACSDYAATANGKAVLEHNQGEFNWADFYKHVPEHLCVRHGFARSLNALPALEVSWDEQLINDDDPFD